MKLSFEKLKALVKTDKLDQGIYEAIVVQTRNQQGPIFDTAGIQEQTIRDLAEEIGNENLEVQATADEVNQERNSREGAARFDWWATTGKNGKRLAQIKFNMDRVIEVLKKLGGLSAANVDKAIDVLDGVLQWEILVPSAPAPAPPTPPAPPPQKRLLPNGEEEQLDLNASDSQMRNASVDQLRDLDARRRSNPSRRQFEAVTQGSKGSPQLMALKHEFPPMPSEVTRKELITCSRGKLEKYRHLYGDASIDARLQGRA